MTTVMRRPHSLGGRFEPIRIYLRQGFTNSSQEQSLIVQGVIDLLQDPGTVDCPVSLVTGVGSSATSRDDFRAAYERFSGKEFTPKNFREERLRMISEADGMVIVRTCMSESTAFEIAFNVYGGRRLPIFFAVHESAPITTTLIKDLEDVIDIRYLTFSKPRDLSESLGSFVRSIAANRNLTKPNSAKEPS